MAECETELKFKLSGRVEGLTKRAKDAITVLNLGESEQSNRSLVEKRKQLVSSLLMVNGVDPDDGLEDDELINLVIADIQQPKDGKLEAYAPVVVNILNQWLSWRRTMKNLIEELHSYVAEFRPTYEQLQAIALQGELLLLQASEDELAEITE